MPLYCMKHDLAWEGTHTHTHTCTHTRTHGPRLRSTIPPAAGLTHQSLIAPCAAKRSVHSSLILLQPWAGVTACTPLLLLVLWLLSRGVSLSDRFEHMHVITVEITVWLLPGNQILLMTSLLGFNKKGLWRRKLLCELLLLLHLPYIPYLQ